MLPAILVACQTMAQPVVQPVFKHVLLLRPQLWQFPPSPTWAITRIASNARTVSIRGNSRELMLRRLSHRSTTARGHSVRLAPSQPVYPFLQMLRCTLTSIECRGLFVRTQSRSLWVTIAPKHLRLYLPVMIMTQAAMALPLRITVTMAAYYGQRMCNS